MSIEVIELKKEHVTSEFIKEHGEKALSFLVKACSEDKCCNESSCDCKCSLSKDKINDLIIKGTFLNGLIDAGIIRYDSIDNN